MRRIVRRIVRLPLSFSATAQYVRPDDFTRGGDLVVVVRFNFRPLLSAAVFSLRLPQTRQKSYWQNPAQVAVRPR